MTYYCNRCDRDFNTYRSYDQHITYSSHHNICHTCPGSDFRTWQGLKEHWVQSRQHSYCQDCDEHFEDDEELEDHYESDHYRCYICRRNFKNARGLYEHNRQTTRH